MTDLLPDTVKRWSDELTALHQRVAPRLSGRLAVGFGLVTIF